MNTIYEAVNGVQDMVDTLRNQGADRFDRLEAAGAAAFARVEERLDRIEGLLPSVLVDSDPVEEEDIPQVPGPAPVHPLVGTRWSSFAQETFNRDQVPTNLTLRVEVGEFPDDASGCPVLWVGEREDNRYGVAPSWKNRSFYSILTKDGTVLRTSTGSTRPNSLGDVGLIQTIIYELTGTYLSVRIIGETGETNMLTLSLERGDGELAAWLGTHDQIITPWDVPIGLDAVVTEAS